MSTLHVDCGTCQVRGHGCADCVVSVLLGFPDDLPVSLSDDEQQAIGVLAASGLVPPLRLLPKPRNPAQEQRRWAT